MELQVAAFYKSTYLTLLVICIFLLLYIKIKSMFCPFVTDVVKQQLSMGQIYISNLIT